MHLNYIKHNSSINNFTLNKYSRNHNEKKIVCQSSELIALGKDSSTVLSNCSHYSES